MRYLAPFICLTLTAGCHYTFSGGYRFDFKGFEASTSDSGAIPKNIQLIEIDNRFGDVKVKPSLNADSMWNWDLTVWASSQQQADNLLARIELRNEFEDDSGRWRLLLPEPPVSDLRGVRSNLTLSVPPSVRVKINNRGNTDVRGLSGRVDVRNRHGDVSLMDLDSFAEISNEHGKIRAAQISSSRITSRHGAAMISEVAGDLNVDAQHARVEVNTVRGSVDVRSAHGDTVAERVNGDVSLQTSHADMTITGARRADLQNRHGRIKATNISGPIRVENQHGSIVVDTESAEVECQNQHGSIKLMLHNPEIRRIRVVGSHSSIHAFLPASITGVTVDVEHGKVNSDISYVKRQSGPYSFKTRHGNVRVEQLKE